MKYINIQPEHIIDLSLPARGAWIEIVMQDIIAPKFLGRSPHGERGLKYMKYVEWGTHGSRSPHGERGLKYNGGGAPEKVKGVAPRTGSVD